MLKKILESHNVSCSKFVNDVAPRFPEETWRYESVVRVHLGSVRGSLTCGRPGGRVDGSRGASLGLFERDRQ